MNIKKLKEAEKRFFEKYPEGFDSPELLKVIKKHNLAAKTEFCQNSFSTDRFDSPIQVVDNMIKIVSRSTLVSLFEKPKFRDYARELDGTQAMILSESLRAMLHGDQKWGFEEMVELLAPEKLAKWTLITVIPVYFRPDYEVFIKPTTVKNILNYLEIEDITYKPLPSYEFYQRFRGHINEMKTYVDSSLSQSNPGFTGFLMMTM